MTANRVFFKIHSFAGLFVGVFILLLSISGAVLVFRNNFTRFTYPKITVSGTKIITVDAAYNSVQSAFPHALVSNCEIPDEKASPFVFSIYDSSYKNGTEAKQVFIHPQTAKTLVQSETGLKGQQMIKWLSTFHSSFQLSKTGEWLLGVFALVFIISLLSGFILFGRKIADVLLFKKAVYNRKNLHQVIGVYALLFNLLMAVSGFWMQRYVFKKDFYAPYNYAPVFRASPALSFNFDSAYANLKKTYPDFNCYVIYFAQSNAGKTAIYGNRSRNAYVHSKKFADAVFQDSIGQIAKTRFINEISAADRYDIINSQLHMGKYGGMGIKVIYFVFGLTGAFLSITGFLIWLHRRKSKEDV